MTNDIQLKTAALREIYHGLTSASLSASFANNMREPDEDDEEEGEEVQVLMKVQKLEPRKLDPPKEESEEESEGESDDDESDDE